MVGTEAAIEVVEHATNDMIINIELLPARLGGVIS